MEKKALVRSAKARVPQAVAAACRETRFGNRRPVAPLVSDRKRWETADSLHFSQKN
jgi:hypothetical protein